jgi:endonuclease YncB( thermonuclease family)
MKALARRSIILGGLIAGLAWLSCRKSADDPSYRGAVLITLSEIEFDDGDTFFLNRKPIRVLGIDTPEIAHPELGVDEPQPYGPVAAESTRVWFTRAGVIELVPDGLDIYDRRLAHVFLDGELLAIRLIRHGLAYETVSHYGDSGYPDLAQQILDAARSAPKPPFEQPYKWKKKHPPRRSSSRSG